MFCLGLKKHGSWIKLILQKFFTVDLVQFLIGSSRELSVIEFYDSVSSLFVRIEDQVRWLKTPSEDFGGKSPIDLLKLNNKNLYSLREWVDFLARP